MLSKALGDNLFVQLGQIVMIFKEVQLIFSCYLASLFYLLVYEVYRAVRTVCPSGAVSGSIMNLTHLKSNLSFSVKSEVPFVKLVIDCW